jgi:hypothetical protein
MGTFLRSRHGLAYERGFVQGAGRILIAPSGGVMPDGVEDLVILAAGATQYDIVAPFTEVGFTKTGINITRNNAEEDFDVDQQQGSIKRRPSNWEMSVGTQLAEASFETFQTAWELGPISTVTKTTPQLNERHIGLSAPTSYAEKMVAVIFQFPDGTIRAWVFRKCVRAAQESGMTLQKTGEQVSLPMRWTALTDSAATVDTQFGEMFEQIPVVVP